MIAEVAFPIPVDKVFTYLIPEGLQSKVSIGTRVRVPFGGRDLIGWVVSTAGETKVQKLKNVKEIIDTEPLISPSLFRLAQWMAGYYMCPLGQALDRVLSHNFHSVKARNRKAKTQVNRNLSAWIPLPEQKSTIEQVRKDIFNNTLGVFLLKGGSDTGKTEVYMQCVAAAQETGKTSIFLIPEISLTSQFIRMFEERLARTELASGTADFHRDNVILSWSPAGKVKLTFY